MGKMMRLSSLLVLGAVFAFANQAKAGYVVSIVDSGTGMNNLTIDLSDPSVNRNFSVDVVLASATNFNIVSTFTVDFSRAGLQYNGYQWNVYSNGTDVLSGGDDKSVPFIGRPANPPFDPEIPSDFPTVIDANSFPNTAGVDVFFDNFLGAGAFIEGTVVSLDLTVPAGMADGPIEITLGPNAVFFQDIFTPVVPIDGNNGFTLNVVPEPATLALLGVGGLVAVMRRRRKA